jgi:hypothetical protein
MVCVCLGMLALCHSVFEGGAATVEDLLADLAGELLVLCQNISEYLGRDNCSAEKHVEYGLSLGMWVAGAPSECECSLRVFEAGQPLWRTCWLSWQVDGWCCVRIFQTLDERNA